MTLVVDASVAIKWFIEEDGSIEAEALLSSGLLIAPDLIVAEVCNVGWKAVRAGTMLPDQHDDTASLLGAILDELVPMATLARQAAVISRALDHPAYDCFYLALAEQRDARVITADRRLLKRVSATGWAPRVRSLRA
jgi:predicted nucleic acid-binding protein